MAELEALFVDGIPFAGSTTRSDIFRDFLSAVAIFNAYSPGIIESVWVGGSFVSGKRDPDDIDCLFILNEQLFDALPSNTKRNKIRDLGKKNFVRDHLGLAVEAFVLIRKVVGNPWEKGGVTRDAAGYTEIRGAWDDWWLRTNTSPDPSNPPTAADAGPIRGYLEVSP